MNSGIATRLRLYSDPALVTLAKRRCLGEDEAEDETPDTLSRILSHISDGSSGVEVSVMPEMSQPGPADWRVVDLHEEGVQKTVLFHLYIMSLLVPA